VDRAKQHIAGGSMVHRLALYFFYVKCKDNPRVDDKFTHSMPDTLKGMSTKSIAVVDSADVSVAGRSQKTLHKQQLLENSTCAFQKIAEMLANKEAREAAKER
jgi:hypothetical protein